MNITQASFQLPLDCEVTYYPDFLSSEEAWELYHLLLEKYQIHKEQLVIEAGGQLIDTDNYKILFADQELIDRNSHPKQVHGKNFVWSGALEKLKIKVEELTGKTYPLAMALYYPDGNNLTPYHTDQKTSGDETILPSLSLGAIRSFTFRENTTQEVYSLELNHGSLLVMGKDSQDNYMHSLPKDANCKKGRINITFRDANFQ